MVYQRKFVLAAFILLVGVVSFGCVRKPVPVVNQNQNVNTNAVVATSTEEIDTSNWKTYRNEEYGFEFKYPGDWNLQILKLSENCIFLKKITTDRVKINKYTEDVMGSIDICHNDLSDLDSYVKDLGYDISSNSLISGVSSWNTGNKIETIGIKKIKLSGFDSYFFTSLREKGYFVYFSNGQNIYSVTALWHFNEASENEIKAIIYSLNVNQ
jgi:hypothetical protein